ncbi:MAG: methyltransferase domain-containing protein [Candidatus Aminicenantes bacterium]|nr:methyltransferase domain-containing protein [Candidatus Aminicenantes bacterium]
MTVFGETYANQYDELVRDKDYRGECDLIEDVFRLYGHGEIHTLVDFGCGTGNHSIPLAQRGYQVTGVDLSSEMLCVARKKSSEVGASVNWIEGDVRNVQVGGPFDAGLFMYAVFGYLLLNEDVMAALSNARCHIRSGGLLTFDIWYGPAVLTIKPSDRVKIVPVTDGKVIRIVTSRLDTRHHSCQVHYHLWQLTGDHVEAESEELHTVRYFFPLELELMLSQSGFALVSLTAFPSLDRPADETTWNVLGVARAV